MVLIFPPLGLENLHPEDQRSNIKEGGKNTAPPPQTPLHCKGMLVLIHALVSFLKVAKFSWLLMLAGSWLKYLAALHLKLSLAISRTGCPLCLMDLLLAVLVFL